MEIRLTSVLQVIWLLYLLSIKDYNKIQIIFWDSLTLKCWYSNWKILNTGVLRWNLTLFFFNELWLRKFPLSLSCFGLDKATEKSSDFIFMRVCIPPNETTDFFSCMDCVLQMCMHKRQYDIHAYEIRQQKGLLKTLIQLQIL